MRRLTVAEPRVRPRGEDDERGAVLILALILLLVGTVVVGALSYEVTNDVQDSARFASVRSLQYDARSATNLAIQQIRYTPLLLPSQTSMIATLNASPPAPCWDTGTPTTPGTIAQSPAIDGAPAMASWCSTVWSPTSSSTRTVTISTCLATYSAAKCAAAPYLLAVVSFDDYPHGISAPSTAQCVTYCGTSMQLDSWLWSPQLPSGAASASPPSISPNTGPITGGTTVTITGSGFVPGSTVNFVEVSATGGTPAYAPTTDNVVLSVTPTSVTPTTIVVQSPSVIVNGPTTAYWVEVATPTGTSTPAVFTYTTVKPTVTAITPNQGSIAGGSSITVTGSGFLSNAIVHFVQESGGVPVIPAVSFNGSFVNVTTSTSLTVVSPGIVAGSTYFVTVTTSAGTSPTSGADVFTYSYLVPTVSAVSPSQGPNAGGTSVTVTGTGFITGATVTFARGACNGTAYAGSNVTIVNSSTITATSPVVFSAGSYYVYVTTTSGANHYSSSCYPIYTYTG